MTIFSQILEELKAARTYVINNPGKFIFSNFIAFLCTGVAYGVAEGMDSVLIEKLKNRLLPRSISDKATDFVAMIAWLIAFKIGFTSTNKALSYLFPTPAAAPKDTTEATGQTQQHTSNM